MQKRRIGLKIVICILIILLLFILSFSLDLTRTSNGKLKEYDYVISESVNNNNSKIVDIALLGAHDAFSNGITLESEPDRNDDPNGIVTNEVVNTLAKGLVVRMSKAQVAGAKEMLYSGVRYFDVRITKVNGTYYCFHGYLSDTFESYLKEVVNFLKDHKGEYIIFDIQHFCASENSNTDNDWEALFAFIKSVKNSDNKNLFDYVYYSTGEAVDISFNGKNEVMYQNGIGELTYGQVTDNKTKAGAVILAKTKINDKVYFRDGDASNDDFIYTSIRSYWINRNTDKEMFEGIESQIEATKACNYQDILRVNQAQKTGFITNVKIVYSLLEWSLIGLADNFNSKLVSDEERFKGYLDTMPILMVDYVTSDKGNFNDLANKYIKEYNISKEY